MKDDNKKDKFRRKTMSNKRDQCWLTKKVFNERLSTYFIDEKDLITATVVEEMSNLFPDCQKILDRKAEIVFKQVKAESLGVEGYQINKLENSYQISGNTSQALLFGLYGFYRIQIEEKKTNYPFISVPDQKIRMLNHWDNLDGSVERGYAGESIFFDENKFRSEEVIIYQYARLLASVGLNAISINNVNVHKLEASLILEGQLIHVKKIADIFAKFGIKIFLSINYAAPILIGGLKTADPLSNEVQNWWENIVKKIYQIIPNFAGFVVKADSEGEPGPFTYGRNHDEGANLLARALHPYGGLVIWRCFVYSCLQDWRDRSMDRAKAAFDIFVDIDGNFDDNVILQIKNGPIDFQIREPNSPLFGALKKTNQMLEFQITQEYTGQQKHICYLVPMWKETLDYDTKYGNKAEIKHLLKTHSIDPDHSGVAAVANVGMDNNWTGNKLAQANLYGYGRLIWDNQLSSEEISAEWIAMTFSLSNENAGKIQQILLTSRKTYEKYTSPNGIGFMVRPNHHYGPDIDGYEYDRWGTYHYADRNGVGRDRTFLTGTGYTRQYSDKRFDEYENLISCPDELLLFFHHVAYKHILDNGKTLIQQIYDTHFEGVERVESYIKVWKELKNEIDKESFQNVAERLQEQYRSAKDWRDQVNTYFYRKSGISDELKRQIYA